MEKRPSFLVIHTDQQRYDCVGCSGRREGIYTPYIDSIAYQGARFSLPTATARSASLSA